MSEIRFYRAVGEYGFLSNLYKMEAGFWLPDEYLPIIPIVTPVSQPMGDGLAKLLNLPSWPPPQVQNPPAGSQPALTAVPFWYETVVIPKNVDISDIHKLSDVSKVGGIVLSQLKPDDLYE